MGDNLKRKTILYIFLSLIFNFSVLYPQSSTIYDLIAVSGLAGLQEGNIKLVWTYPGPDILPVGSVYFIQYSTFVEVLWSTANAQVVISTGPVDPAEQQVFIITGLDNVIKNNSLQKETSFYFVIWISSGTEMLLSEISNVATGWITLVPPSAPYFYSDQCLPGIYEGTINLLWSGSGDDGTSGILDGSWYIQYSTYESFSDWDYKNYSLKISTHDVPAWLVKSYLVSGLIPGVTYYFRLWAEDDLGNVSDISDGATTWVQVDILPPRPVTYITVQPGFRHIKLNWVVPYEDSYSDGFVYNSSSYTAYYEIRWRNDQIISNDIVWNNATSYGVFGPCELWPLVSTTTVVTGLVNFTSYYFVIKVADERFNWSKIGVFTIGGVVYTSSSPFCKPVNSPPQPIYPQNHFVYDPITNSTATIISSTTVKIDWSNTNWHAGYHSGVFDQEYGDYVSSFTVKLATYTIGGTLGIPMITVEGLTSTYCLIHNLIENMTYYWTLTCYDSESLSSTTVTFKFVVNSTNSEPVFPQNPLLSPTTVWHTNEYKITFSWKSATDPDPFDYVVGYKIFISSDQTNWYSIPESDYITTNSTTVVTQNLYCYDMFLNAENNKIYWYVVAYDSGAPFGYPQLSTNTPIGIFWLNQCDDAPLPFEVYFPSGTQIVLSDNCTYYKIIIGGTTYYPIMEKIVDDTVYYIAKSTPIILSWYPTSDPDPEDGIIEYALFISTTAKPEASSNAWRYMQNPVQDYAPYESVYWFNQWSFFVSTSIVNLVEPGTQEDYNLVLYENTSYYWRVRARDSTQNIYWIWDSTQTFSPSLEKTPVMFIVDFISEPPSKYNIVTPTGVINPSSLEGPIYFDWTDAIDPDPFDSLKYYFISVTTVCPQNTDAWFTAPFWKINTWLGENPVSSTTLLFTYPKLVPGTTYYWQVHSWGRQEWEYAVNRSTSQPYLVKPYSVAITTGIFAISNQKPYKFSLISPGTSTISQQIVRIKTYRPTFYWEQVYDPDNYDPIISSYVVVISSNVNFVSSYQIYTSTTYLCLNFDLQSRTTYYWYVIAYDKFCNSQTPYSTFYFVIANLEPNSFSLISPTDDKIVSTLSPIFEFQNNGDPDGDIIYYTLQYSSWPDFSVYESSSGWNNLGFSSTIYILSPWIFEENKQYFWRVIADDNFEGVTVSSISSFWVNAYEEPPHLFDLHIISGIITQQYINFSWTSTDDDDPKDYIQFYKLYISSVTGYVVGVSSYVTIFGSTTVSYNFDISHLTENAVYQWWVEAYDTTNRFTKSLSSYSFIVNLKTDPPDDIQLLCPGSDKEFVKISSSVVTFRWTPANKSEWWEQMNYIIYISSFGGMIFESNFSSGPYNKWYEADEICFSTGPLQENTTYFWWVVAYNSAGITFSTTYYFFYDTKNDPPYNFELVTPSGTVSSRRVNFSWFSAIDPDDKVSHYILKYSTTATFAISYSTIVLSSEYIVGYTTELNLGMTYYWKVETYDTRGGFTKSATWVFYIPMLKPYPVDNISPQGVVLTRTPPISWSVSNHVDPNAKVAKYRMILSNNLQTNQVIITTETVHTNFEIPQKLLQNITYYISVVAIDDIGVESDTRTVSFFIPVMDIPQKVKVKQYEVEKFTEQLIKVKIQWEKVSKYIDNTQADDIAGYNLYRSTVYKENAMKLYKFIPSTVTFFSEYVSSSDTYYYDIRTVTATGVESDSVDEVLTTIFNGARILTFPNYKLVLPNVVYSDLENKGLTIVISTQQITTFEFERLNITKKYEIEVLKNGYTQQYKFSPSVLLEINKDEIHLSSSFNFAAQSGNSFKPAMFLYNGVEYVLVPTEYSGESVNCMITKPGMYALRLVNLPSKPEIIQVYPKKIITPTVSENNKIHFVIYNPTVYQPEGEIYDLDLRFVAKLKYENGELIWDGKYENGEYVNTGVYLYRIKVGNKTFSGSVIVAK